MWVFSVEFGAVVLATLAVLGVLVWRVRVWLDRWAKAMIACFPEMLQIPQGKQIQQERKTAALSNAKHVNVTVVPDRRTREGMAKHHFDRTVNGEPASASASGTLSGD
jgi:hypothetical protein